MYTSELLKINDADTFIQYFKNDKYRMSLVFLMC